ncbi:MAG: hypothetical protein DI562_02060 [Stenotrophomonas acidaminiphila]|nr:MAG: hypothetical protein DI562_02060 [Stenotrophomonas acidaminiphila]
MPTLGAALYLPWGGVGLALMLFGILFALLSGFIHWHGKDPHGFHKGIRVWIVLLLLIPSVLLCLGTALTSPVLLPLGAVPLGISIWLLARSNKRIRHYDVPTP